MITVLDSDSDMSTNNSRLCINSDNEDPDFSEVDLDLSQSTDCEVDETQQHEEVHVRYMVLLWLIMFFEAWMSINAAMVYFLKMGSCSVTYSLSFYHFTELSFAIGYGLCNFKSEYIGYVIVASILTNVIVIVILLELVGHLLETQLKYGQKIAVICHIVTIASFILLVFFFIIMDMQIHGMRTFNDSAYYVYATAFTTGDRSPYGFYPSPDMTTSMGTLAERILNIACMQLLSTGYAYCASVIACVFWSKFIKQASLTHLEVKLELMDIKTRSAQMGVTYSEFNSQYLTKS